MNNKNERDARLFETSSCLVPPIYNTGYKFDDERKMPYPYYKAVDPSRYFQTISAQMCGDDVDFCGDFFDTSSLTSSQCMQDKEAGEELEEIFTERARRDAVSNLQHVSSNVRMCPLRISRHWRVQGNQSVQKGRDTGTSRYTTTAMLLGRHITSRQT